MEELKSVKECRKPCVKLCVPIKNVLLKLFTMYVERLVLLGEGSQTGPECLNRRAVGDVCREAVLFADSAREE